jgi:hypothetical protein
MEIAVVPNLHPTNPIRKQLAHARWQRTSLRKQLINGAAILLSQIASATREFVERAFRPIMKLG